MHEAEQMEKWCYTAEGMEWAREQSMNNLEAIDASQWAGCFYCGELFKADQVKSYIQPEGTALCPLCHIDSVIGDASGAPLSHKFLERMHMKWFS